MKKKWMKRIAVGCMMAFGLSCVAGVAAIQPQTASAAETDYRGWGVGNSQTIGASTADKKGVNVKNPTRVEDKNGVKQDFLNADYLYKADMEAGQEFAYMLPDDVSLSIGEEVYQFQYPNKEAIIDRGEIINDARLYNHSYVKYTVLNKEDKGFEVVMYHQYADDSVNPNHIFANLYYLSPDIKADGGDKTAGRHYVETVFSYETNFETWHTVSCFKENGWFFISVDGTSFVPVPEYGDIDLTEAKVSVEAKSIDMPSMQLDLKAPTSTFERNTYDGWMTLGESTVSREEDGTLKFVVDEKNDQLNWVYNTETTNMLLRERVINMQGYSVDEPIVIQCSMDIGPQNYYSIKLANNPFETALPIKYSLGGAGSTVDSENSPFNQEGNLAFSKIGSCVFVGKTAISARIIPENNPNTTEYYVAWSAIPNNTSTYQGLQSLDEIKFIVGENGTDVYFNGIFAFTLRNMTRETYAESGYMAYPYFAFSELPPQPDKSNVFHLKGVNAPTVKHDSVTRYKLADGDLTFDAEVYGEEVSLYFDKECRQAIAAEHFVCADGKLTLKTSLFRGKPFGLNSIYVKTVNGMEEIAIRYLPDSYVELTPEVVTDQRDDLGNYKVTFDRKIVTGYEFIYDEEGNIVNVGEIYTEDSTLDLRMTLKLYEHEFVRLYGYGISSANYMYNERQNILLIRNAFLTAMDNGEYTFTLVTKDSDGVEKQTKLVVEIVNYSPFEVILPGEEEEEAPADNNQQQAMISCSAALNSSYLWATALILGAACVVTLKNKKENLEEK